MKRITFFIALIWANLLTAQSSWNYLPNAPAGTGRIDDVFFLDTLTGWSGSASGKVHKTTDGGQTWNLQLATGYVRCVEFVNADLGFVGTLDKKFFRTTNGGQIWTNIINSITPKPDAVCGISCIDSLYSVAVGEWDSPAFFLKTITGGMTWVNKSMTTHANALVDVLFLSRDTGFVSGKSSTGATILYTTDGGVTWTEKYNSNTPGEYVWKMQRINKSNHWVGSVQTFGGGKMVKSSDNGQTWTAISVPMLPDMQGIGFATPLHGWVGGYINGFFETIDEGQNWEFKDFGGNFNRFHFIDSTLAFASGESIYKFSPTQVSTQPNPKPMKDDGFKLVLSPNPVLDRLYIEYDLPVQKDRKSVV